MGTKMGFPPGVRIQLRDNSAYSVETSPFTTAGIVGFASKGELNKIIQVNSTAEQDAKLGYGYQSYKYNQGMYAARAVLDAGGVVEFVRPYGEEIDRTDPRKRDLKTDAFVVTFDKNAGQQVEGGAYENEANQNSFRIEHFASTRYKTDGASSYGLTRKINNISEAIVSGNNVVFGLTASEDFADSPKARKWDGSHCTDMVLFSILNRDPSYAYRAYDRFEVVGTPKYTDSTTVQATLSSNPTFVIGDEVLLPATGGRNSAVDLKAEVVDIVNERDITLKIQVDGTSNPPAPQYFSAVIFSPDQATAIEDGFDYMNIKTAVAGQGVKKFDAIQWGVTGGSLVAFDLGLIKTGTAFTFKNKNGNDIDIRLWKASQVTATVTVDGDNLKIAATGAEFAEGDVLSLGYNDVMYTDLFVKAIDEGVAVVDKPREFSVGTGTAKVTISECSEVTFYADVTNAACWKDVADAVVKVLNSSSIGFAKTAVVNDINVAEGDVFIVDPSAAFDYAIGDKVIAVLGSDDEATVNDAILSAKLEVTDVNTFNGTIKVNVAHNVTIPEGVRVQLLNLSTTSAVAYNAVVSAMDVERGTAVPKTVTIPEGQTSATTTLSATAGYTRYALVPSPDTATATWNGTDTLTVSIAEAAGVGGTEVTVTATPERDVVRDMVTTYIVSSYTMYVNPTEQIESVVVENTPNALDAFTTHKALWNIDVEKSKKVLADGDIGATFLGLGLAKTSYLDVDFDNNPRQVYVLTDEGVNIARMYLSIRYRFNGKVYEFDGTIIPYSTSSRIQLGIKYAADYELTNSGLEFVLNDSGVLEYFLENSSYDLSQSLIGGTLNGSVTCVAYNENDPAIKYDAVWSYNPLNNRSGSTLSAVWNLFLNKDGSDVDMLVAAGMAINNPFMNKIETLNTQVMQAMLNVCEARKDCFALFDAVSEPDIEKAIKKDMDADGFVSTIGRWGFIYDGRGLVMDSVYTNGEAEIMKSIQLASIITGNRQSGVYWQPPSGYDQAPVPSAWGTKEKYTRTYSAEDKNCDVGRLNDIHVNATRVNREGMIIWGDFTMQMEDTAFNQAHVTMLVAGIHKSFYKYLDHKVFRLNTTNLRAQITSDLQGRLNVIKRGNPQGLVDGKVICDDTNNTPDIVEQNFLIVDVKLLPTKSARWIILRTSVESTQNGNKISTEIIMG